jgi:hypothetical protein
VAFSTNTFVFVRGGMQLSAILFECSGLGGKNKKSKKKKEQAKHTLLSKHPLCE